jgi:hemerythrin-like domain-containing protein
MIQIGAPAATIDSPIEHLMACHRRIEQRLDTLVDAPGYMTSRPAEAQAAIANSLHFLDTNGVLHTEDEEASLFPRLRGNLSASESAFIDSLEAQHDEAESIYSELKQLAAEKRFDADYRERAERLRALYRAHIRTEDEVLMALAKRSLGVEQLGQISREMRERRASLSTRSTNPYMPKQPAQSTPETIAPDNAVSV